MNENECQHEYEHLETVRWRDMSGGYNTKFTRIDRFFCKRCLHSFDKRQEEYCRDAPAWYRSDEK